MVMMVVNLLAGALLLFMGRRLFWLYVAGVGFIVGAMLATEWWGDKNEWLVLAFALGLGVLGALVSVFLQQLVIAIAGFLAGGYVLFMLVSELHYESIAWIAFLVGGIIGAIMGFVVFDWALIILSSLIGATVIARIVPLDRTAAPLLFVALLIVGLVVQAIQLSPRTAAPNQAKS